MLQVFGAAVGMVEQTGDEEGRAAADGQPVPLDEFENPARIPHVAQVDGRTLQDRDQQRTDHADEVPDRRGGQLPAPAGRVVRQELSRFAAQRLVTVDHALGVAGGAGREGDQCRRGGVRRHRAVHRFVGEQVVEVAFVAAELTRGTDQADEGDVGAQIRLIPHAPEFHGGDEHARCGGSEDVTQFLAPVEMHDGHDHGAEQG